MTSESLQTLLDAAAGDLVTADYESLQDVGQLCSSFEKVRDAAAAAGHMRIAGALARAVGLINKMLHDAACDQGAAVDTLSKLLSAIQHALRPGTDPEQLVMPAGLMEGAAFTDAPGSTPERLFVVPEHLDRSIFNEFISDQENVLANLEELLLKLEQGPDAETLADLRRLFHTLKGEAGVFQLRSVERLCHATEDLIDTQPDCIAVDVLLSVKDWLKDFFDAIKLERSAPAFTADILRLLNRGTEAPGTAVATAAVGLSADAPQKFVLSPFIDPEIFSIFIIEQNSALKKMESMIRRIENGSDLDAFDGLKCLFHTLNGGSGVCGLMDVEHVCCCVEDAIEKDPDSLSPPGLLGIRHWLQSVFDALKADRPLPVYSESLVEMLLVPDARGASGLSRAGEQAAGAFVDDVIFHEFVEEQESVAGIIEALVLRLDSHHERETMQELKRVFHTLKGEARVFGLRDIEKICHTVEDLLENCRDTLPVDALFAVKDYLSRCFRAFKNRGQAPELTPAMIHSLAPAVACGVDALTAAVVYNPLKGAVEFKTEPAAAATPAGAHDRFAAVRNPLTADLDLLSDFVSEVKEHIENIDNRLLSLENNPGDSDLLNAVFRFFHTIKGAAGFLALDEISRLSHITESLLDLARKGQVELAGGSIDVVFEAVDEMKNLVGAIEKAIATGISSYPTSGTVDRLVDKIKSILSAQPETDTRAPFPSRNPGNIPATALPSCSSSAAQAAVDAAGSTIGAHIPQPVPGTPQTATDTDVIGAELSGQGTIAAEGSQQDTFADHEDHGSDESQSSVPLQSLMQQRAKIKESIKVDAENLDKLIDAIGELVIIEAMIRQDGSVRSAASSDLLRNMTQMDKITRELQTLGMSLRMIPIKATFQKMARVVRDLAKKSGKQIEFSTVGEDTMLDKSVVDRIGDPLIHLVRNAVDHGIESTHEARRRAGKNSVGEIVLTAFHKGGNIYVEIRDDGRGLNREEIQKKGIEKGLLREGHQLSEREIFNMILLPGFSTAAKVTDVSGRGVGMDVVKRTVDDLRGNIDIISEPGCGTTISLRLPLTLAIIDGMLVRIGPERYIIPTLSIVESVRPRPEDISTIVNRGEMITIRNTLIPLFRLADLFNNSCASRSIADSIVIVVEDSGRMTGLMVDELLGQQTTVIKSLGALKGLTGISGGSIMTDGSVGIILDIAGIVKLATGDSSIEPRYT